MRCTRARSRLPALVLDTATEAERRGLSAHLAECPACRLEMERLRTLDATLRRLDREPSVSAGLEAAVMRRVAGSAPGAGRAGWPLRLPEWAGGAVLAGGVAAVLALAFVSGTRTPTPLQLAFDETPVRSRPEVATPPGPVTDRQGTVVAQAPRPAGAAAVPADPPPELRAALDLLLDLPLVENLEKLQNYEVIESATLAPVGESNG